MPIDVACPGCRKTLRAPDTVAGKRVKCPQCGAAISVPQPVSAPPAAYGGVADLIDEAINEEVTKRRASEEAEYERQQEAAIEKTYNDPKAKAAEKREKGLKRFRPRKLSVGDSLGRAWGVFTANYGLCLGVTLFNWLLGSLAFGTVMVGFWLLGGLLGAAIGGDDLVIAVVIALVAWLIGYVVALIVPSLLLTGTLNVFLKLARGEPAEFMDTFRAVRHTFSLWGGMVIWSMIQALPYIVYPVLVVWTVVEEGEVPIFMLWVLIGSWLALFPVSIWLSMKFSNFMFAIVDLDVGTTDAYGSAGEISSGNMLGTFLMLFLCGWIYIGGAIVLGIGALLFSFPFILTILAVAYIDMVGKKPRA